LGLHTVGEIAQTPRSTLIRALGDSAGASLYELAWGRDYREVTPDHEDKSISAAETFTADLEDPEEILQEFLRLTQRATARLREKNLFAKTIGIKVRYADFSTINRTKTLPLAIDNAHETYEVVKNLYLALNIGRARLRLVGVSLENLQRDAPEQMILGARERGWREAETAMDQAKARFGGKSVRPGRLISSSEEESDPQGE
jgi:DNA polymerase-4